MEERFEFHTMKRSIKEGIIADYWLTTLYDRETGNAVTCAGNTRADSETNARRYLDVLNVLSTSNQEANRESNHSLRIRRIVG